MSPEEYVRDRLDDQITWYDQKSQCNQKWFRGLRVLEILFAMSIPFLVSEISNDTNYLKAIVGIMAVCVAVISGLVTLYKFQENWNEYRTTCESLKHEKYLFLTQVEPYEMEERFSLFVQRVENLISKENSAWSQYTHSGEEASGGKGK